MKLPVFKSKTTAITVGVGLFLAGSYCFYDAWEGRGGKPPKLVRPFLNSWPFGK